MSMRDRLIRLAALKMLGDAVKDALDREKAAIKEEVGGRMSAAAAVLDGVGEIGTVTIAEGRYPNGTVDGWAVVDEVAFVKWVRKNRPTAIVEVVRSSDVKSILGSITDEVPDGVMAATRGEDYVVVNQSADQKANAVKAWRSGALQMPGMEPQIEEAPDVDS